MAMTPPWEADRPLTLDIARAAVSGRFPRIASASLEYLASGWEFDVYRTADGWVFRFPRRGAGADLFDAESRVHKLVAPFLPSHVALPRVELLGEPGFGFPYRFAGHRFIPGAAADALDADLRPVLAREIGELLGAIHAIPETEARAAGIAEFRMDDGRQAWVDRCLRTLSTIRIEDDAISQAVTWILQESPLVRRFQGPVRFIHHDLSPRHLLVDPNTARLNGVLDWTDSTLGDSARDFVFLVAWRGWAFVEQVMTYYPLAMEPSFRARVERSARVLSLLWFAEAYERHMDLAMPTRSVRNAFRIEA